MPPERHALVLVDIQPDFLPRGNLAVTDGDAILDPVRDLMMSDAFALLVATQDWHPPDHVSFASNHPGRKPLDVMRLYDHDQVLWPDHCVQGTAGADLVPGLPWDRVAAIVRKGTDPRSDSYSGFRNNWTSEGDRPPTGLAGYLRERAVEDVTLVGLARDYCVKWSAEDAAALGFRARVVWDLTRPVDPSSDEQVRRALERAGVGIVRADDL